MTSLFTDYGYGGEILTTNKPDKFTIVREDRTGRLAYEANQHVNDMRIAAQRLDRVAEDLARLRATDEALEDLRNAARDCEMALAAAIAKLCGDADAQVAA